MARELKNLNSKRAIYVFWEGESEAEYSKFLSRNFRGQAAIKIHREKGTFAVAQAYCRGNRNFQSIIGTLDEVWFFFDTEISKGQQWDECKKCISNILRFRRSKRDFKIRLLMTSCCVEYWFLLHFVRTRPAIATPADKERVLKTLQKYVPDYQKGNAVEITKIGEHYMEAVSNGKWGLMQLRQDGMPDEIEERDHWLFRGMHTFTTVHEAVEMLMNLPPLL